MEDTNQDERIRRRAYELWQHEGGPEGRAEEFWHKALSSLQEEDSAQGTSGDQPANAAGDAAPNKVERQADKKIAAKKK
ncbi:hypothetical protein AWB75_06693 [Caballeronia catudaia]|uniref:DUF2934 domain-containing protein n=1 Tax=Caballeronia catudaia TaxID=1777136 RepID=A0A158DG87_9BURK|nr:DUF2934 domain-containing protein [Caballeronia catudaia]SAK93555.1 hypothetical protein AWB75_06693 [Caballeronia catudaia]